MAKEFFSKLNLARFISNVELKAGSANPDYKINNEKERSIFQNELDKYAEANNLSNDDVNQIYGLVMRRNNETDAAAAPAKAARAPQTRAANGPDIVINVGNEYNFNISVQVQNDFKAAIEEFFNGKNIDAIINALVENMGDLGDKVLNAFVQILHDQFGDSFEFKDVTDLLNQIVDRLDKQNEQIGDLTGKVDDLQKQLIYYAEQNLEVLTNLGVDTKALVEAVKVSNEKQDKQYEIMNEIYNAIMDLMNKAGDMSAEFQAFVDTITVAIKNGTAKMDDVIELLKGIKEDTSANKEISANILEAVNKFGAEGVEVGKAILDAIKELKMQGAEGNEFSKQILALIQNNNVQLGDLKELLEAIKANTDDTSKNTKEILEVLKNMNEVLAQLGETSNESKEALTAIFNAIVKNGEGIEDLKEVLVEIKNANAQAKEEILQAIKDINIVVEGGSGGVDAETKAVLVAILNATLKNGEGLDGIKELLEAIKSDTAEGNKTSKEILEVLKGMSEVLDKLDNDSKASLTAILNAISGNGQSLEDIKEILNAIKDDTSATQATTKEILAAIKDLGDVITQFDEKTQAALTALLNVSIKNGENLEGFVKETAANFKAVLEALAELKAGGAEQNANLEALLDKVLSKMDENTAAIIEAMANIKVDGGNVDTSALEKMLAELVELAGDNKDLLTSIDAKLDAIKFTASAIEAKLEANFAGQEENFEFVKKILTAIENNTKATDEDVLLSLEALLAKLGKIEELIADHEVEVTVEVDVTGKVTCECNCDHSNDTGNPPHEGIIGDLESIANCAPRRGILNDGGTTGVEEVRTNTAQPKGKKYYDTELRKMVILRGDELFDLSGNRIK